MSGLRRLALLARRAAVSSPASNEAVAASSGRLNASLLDRAATPVVVAARNIRTSAAPTDLDAGSGSGPPPVLPPVRSSKRGVVSTDGELQDTVVQRPADGGWSQVTVKDTGEVYYWNERTGETTAVGEPRPGPEGRVQAPPQQAVGGAGTSLAGLVAMGAGVGLVFGIIGKIF